jgi:CHAT domain-containing protein/tetratricopeptide (TPR) repeat protein
VSGRVAVVAAVVLLALAGWGACRPSPQPRTLFAEAEKLRLEYRKEAAHKAIATYREALSAWNRIGDKQGAARAARRIGTTFGQLGLLHESLASHLEALPLVRASADRLLESEILSDLGAAQALVADSDGGFDKARGWCVMALDLARNSGGRREVAKAVTCRGDVEYYHQKLDRALEFYREAERLWTELGDLGRRAETLRLQGAVYSDEGYLDQAGACYQKAWTLWPTPGDKRDYAVALILDARLEARRGEYQVAQNKFENALTLVKPMGDAVWEASCLTGIATVYQDMGETRFGLEYWDRALQLFDGAGLKSISADVLFFLGEIYLAAGDDANAIRRFERALALAEELGIQRWKAVAERLIGVVHLVRREPLQALGHLEGSLKLQQSLQDPKLEGRVYADVGEAHDLLGDHELAVEDLQRALARSREAGDRPTSAKALFGLARASLGLNNLTEARTYIQRSLDVVESLRTEVESRDLRASYFASVYRYNEFQTDILMRLHQRQPSQNLAAVAFESNERARARSLLEGLTEAGVDLTKDADPDLLNRERRIKAAFGGGATRQTRLSGAPASEAARALAAEHRELEERYGQVQAEIRSKSPRYAALVRPQPLRLQEVQQQVLDADTLLLEYALGQERSYLWVVSRTGQWSYVLPPRAEIEEAARRVYALLTARLETGGGQQARLSRIQTADEEYWQDAARLSEMLLGPVAVRLASKRLLIVADGALHYVPFGALPVPGRGRDRLPMAVDHEIVGLPSASVLAALRRETAGRTPPPGAVAVLADPVFEGDDPRVRAAIRAAGGAIPTAAGARGGVPSRLDMTRKEADAILAVAPPGLTLTRIGFDASLTEAERLEIGRYRVVHFATHGVFDDENPELSGIYLSLFNRRGQAQPGFLGLHDIYSLRLPVELVVLSACNTALGKLVKVEGLVGIVRGFMYAGAKRVVASLWKVDDEATAELMRLFYLEMFRQNRSPAAALRQAQLTMRQQERWRAPFYWAGFVLQGEWK